VNGGDFPVLDAPGVYLNHAAIAPWPRVAAEAVQAFAAENAALGARHYSAWMAIEERLHRRLAALLGAERDDIAIVKNTSDGLSLVAAGRPWRAGDEVVIGVEEFPSNRLPWLALEKRGVVVREVSVTGAEPEVDLIAACTARTKLLSISAVQYSSGLRLDLECLGTELARRDIRFCIDAIQQLGALPLDVQRCHCDYLAADAHKWLLGPEGVGVFYSSRRGRAELEPLAHGWRMYPEPFDFARRDWTPPAGAVRYEAGSPNMIGIVALDASLGVLLDTGIEAIERRLIANRNRLAAALAALPDIEIVSPQAAARQSGIVSFRHRALAAADIQRELLRHDIVAAARNGAVRLSPHFYQPPEMMDTAAEIIGRAVLSISQNL